MGERVDCGSLTPLQSRVRDDIVTWGLCFVGNDTTYKVGMSGVQVLHKFCQRLLKHKGKQINVEGKKFTK